MGARGSQGNDLSGTTKITVCLKHFIGYGAGINGKDRASALIPENYLRQYYLPPFTEAIKSGALTIMLSSNSVNGIPCHINKYYMTDILKGELNFPGYTVSDFSDIDFLVDAHQVAHDKKEATKQAILAKKQIVGTNITVYYNDVRAVGKFCEEFYNRAQEEFQIRYIKSNISSVVKSDANDQLLIRGENVFTGKLFEDPSDLIVLAVGTEPPEGTEELANLLNISTDPNGFLLESHLKVRPSDSSVKGIYIAGAIQSPKDIPSSIAQAESAAAKSIALLTKGKVDLDPLVVRYNKDLCDLCRLCENVCEFNAIEIVDDTVNIIGANCVGCGACAAMCHTNALEVPGFTKEEVLKQIKVIMDKKKDSPLIVTFLCNWCSYLGADLAGTSKIQYPTNTRPIHVMCTAMLDPSLVFEALFNGADGVLIAGCHPQDCHYISGFKKAENRYESITSMLEELKVNNDRVKIISISAGEGQKFADTIKEFSENLKKLGPISKDIKGIQAK